MRIVSKEVHDDKVPNGTDVLKVIFTPDGPAVLLTEAGECWLRGERRHEVRQLIEDTLRDVLNNIFGVA